MALSATGTAPWLAADAAAAGNCDGFGAGAGLAGAGCGQAFAGVWRAPARLLLRRQLARLGAGVGCGQARALWRAAQPAAVAPARRTAARVIVRRRRLLVNLEALIGHGRAAGILRAPPAPGRLAAVSTGVSPRPRATPWV